MHAEAVSFILWQENESGAAERLAGRLEGFPRRSEEGLPQSPPQRRREKTRSKPFFHTTPSSLCILNNYRGYSRLCREITSEVFLGSAWRKLLSPPRGPQNEWMQAVRLKARPQNVPACPFMHSMSRKHGFSAEILPQNGCRPRSMHSMAQK